MKIANKDTVSVIFASNDNYSMLLGVALCSLFENKKGDYPIKLYVVDFGISAKNKERLGVLEKKYDFVINYVVPAKALFEKIPRVLRFNIDYAPIEIYHHIFLAHFLPAECRRVIDIDVDVIVRGDIAEVLNIDLEGRVLGAIPDCEQEKRQTHLKRLREDINWPVAQELPAYFNAGVVLVDLELWRKSGTEEKLLRLLREHQGKLRYHEQDALNLVLAGDYKELGMKYNFIAAAIPERAYSEEEPNPLIVHFAGGGKPWYFFSALPYQPEYIYYINKTSWKRKKYRKVMDIYFAKKYHIYFVMWPIWSVYKKIKKYFAR
ncbi:MAG: glycosyltransferase family 8 protein [Patescibacteria group bacterium]